MEVQLLQMQQGSGELLKSSSSLSLKDSQRVPVDGGAVGAGAGGGGGGVGSGGNDTLNKKSFIKILRPQRSFSVSAEEAGEEPRAPRMPH